jgi:hypothetical protein
MVAGHIHTEHIEVESTVAAPSNVHMHGTLSIKLGVPRCSVVCLQITVEST